MPKKEFFDRLCSETNNSFDEYESVSKRTVFGNCRVRSPAYYILEYENSLSSEAQNESELSRSETSIKCSEFTFYDYIEIYKAMEENPLSPYITNLELDTTNTENETTVNMPSTSTITKHHEDFEKKRKKLVELLMKTYETELEYESKITEIIQLLSKMTKLLVSQETCNGVICDQYEEQNVQRFKDELSKVKNMLISITDIEINSKSEQQKSEPLSKFYNVLWKLMHSPIQLE